VSWEEVKKYYLKSDAFVFTSLRESFGSQLLEAMAYGLPIISLDQSGAQYFVPQEAGIRVPVRGYAQIVEDIARAIEYIGLHPGERAHMGRASYAFARENLWNKRAGAMKSIYQKYIPESTNRK
jgi:glycosyltransferase involved in cell wall biosynthesis